MLFFFTSSEEELMAQALSLHILTFSSEVRTEDATHNAEL